MPAKKKVTTNETPNTDAYQVPRIDGFGFRWVNPAYRAKKGNWGIWKPLTRDSELGEKVAEHIEGIIGPISLGLTQVDSNYFYRSTESMLAFAPVELIEEKRAEAQAKADERMRMVHRTEGARLRTTVIEKTPGE